MRPGITRLITAAVADPDDARRRRLLNVLLIATLCCTLVGLFVTIAAQWAEPGDADGWGAMYAAIMATLIVCVGIMGLAHVKLPGAGHLASVLYLLWLLMLAPATDSPAQVVAGRSLFWFVLPILAAPFLQRPGASFVLFAVSCAVTLAVAYSKQIPIVPNLFGLLVVFAIALVAWLAARGLEDALADVRHQEALRLAAERARADALAQQAIVLEQRVQERTGVLAASNRQQIEFLHAVSHEMRSPLQGAMLCCEILQRSPDLPAEQQSQVEQIDFALERLQRLLSDILDTAWLGHGVIVPDVQDISDLGALVRDALRILQPQIDEAGLVVQVTVPACRLRGDPDQLVRVLLNLLSNAVKYSRPGGPVACVASVDDDQFHLRVTDTGIGIPAGELESIFEPLKRSSRSRAIPGVGLGLLISRQIVELHGGRIWAESTGSGSTFHVVLPLPVPSPAGTGECFRRGPLSKWSEEEQRPDEQSLIDGELLIAVTSA